MSGFSAQDQIIAARALENYMPGRARIRRVSFTKTSGDPVPGTDAVIASNVKCRVLPITMMSGRTMLSGWPAALVEKAEYIMTFAQDVTLEDGDTAEIDDVTYNITGVRYDNGSWGLVMRCLGVRVE